MDHTQSAMVALAHACSCVVKNVVNCTLQRRLSAYEHCGGASEPSGRLWGLLGQPLPTGQSMGWRLRSKQLRTSWIILQAEGRREGRP